MKENNWKENKLGSGRNTISTGRTWWRGEFKNKKLNIKVNNNTKYNQKYYYNYDNDWERNKSPARKQKSPEDKFKLESGQR